MMYSSSLHKIAISEIHSIKQARSVLKEADAKTLVLFDCDDTLIMPVDKLIQEGFRETKAFRALTKNFKWYVFLKSLLTLNFSYRDFLISKICTKISFQFVEPIIVDEIKALQEREVKVIALTLQDTGSIGAIDQFEVWRFEKLYAMGIDFSASFNEQAFHLDVLPAYKGNYPVFYRGILCANYVAKGKVLGAFLDKMSWTPGRVIFFDNTKEHVDSVAQEMQRRSINFCGYVYKAADRLLQAVDLELVKFQLDYLKKHEEWLSDGNAAQMMQKKF